MNSIRQFKALSVVVNVDTGPINKKLILENDSLKKKLEAMEEKYEKIMLMKIIGDRIEYNTFVPYYCVECRHEQLEAVPDEQWLEAAEQGYITADFRKDNAPHCGSYESFTLEEQPGGMWDNCCPECELILASDEIFE
jgi:hypothetical protein